MSNEENRPVYEWSVAEVGDSVPPRVTRSEDGMKKTWFVFLGLMAIAPLALGQAKDFPNRPIKN